MVNSARSNLALLGRLQTVSRLLALLVTLTGGVVFCGWILDWSFISSAEEPSMKLQTAFLFGLSGATLWRFHRAPRDNPDLVVTVGAAFVAIMGLMGFLDSFLHFGAKIQRTELKAFFLSMSPATAMVMFLSGMALSTLNFKMPSVAQACAIAMGALALVGLIGLSYNVHVLSNNLLFSTMSVATTLCGLSLSTAILLACPQAGWMKPFTAEAGGAVMRRLLPFIIGLPFVYGWLRVKGEQAGLYQSEFGAAMLVIATSLSFALLVVYVGRVLNRSEEARQKALEQLHRHEEELAQYAKQLEERVAERTWKLEATIGSLESFVYTIAHDLRAPLRAMHGFSLALEEENSDRLDVDGKEYCRRIRNAADRMDRLISDLLEFGRLAHIDVPSKLVDLNTEVETVLAMLQEPIEKTGAEIRVEKPLPKVCGEPKILDQVLLNLIANALKFVPQNVSPKVHIYTEQKFEKIRLWVEDNGIGIEQEHTERIFEIFQRLHSNEAYPGTGIGLAIVQKAVEKMGGEVGVESEIGKGSRFWIELPNEPCCAA